MNLELLEGKWRIVSEEGVLVEKDGECVDGGGFDTKEEGEKFIETLNSEEPAPEVTLEGLPLQKLKKMVNEAWSEDY